MRARCLFGLALLVACKAPAGSPGEHAPTSASSASTEPKPEPDVLPPVAQGWAPPHLESESGKCWVRLHRLSDTQIEAVRSEFLARNPGWELNPLHIDAFTGIVDNASRLRKTVGAALQLPDDVYALRRLAPLRRNADLIGLTAGDLDEVTWEPGSFHGNTSDLTGSSPNALLRCQPGPRFQPWQRDCGSVVVRFQRDGVVSGFGVRRYDPPAELCRVPSISKEQARHSPGLFDASARAGKLDYLGSAMTVTPDQVGEARLGIDMSLEDGEPATRARSVTWRLVWEVDVKGVLNGAYWTFLVDANSGKTVGLRQNGIE